ncbi:MAG: hypothetical protein EB127_12715 [Alphaproteobacteria bacterium]|nr:hypothetical protein [Alphaproteobacteria bacterium]
MSSPQVGFSSSVGEGTTHASKNYNRKPAARGPVGPGSPNFTGYFKPRGTQSGPSNISSLSAAMGAMTLGEGGRRKNKTNKNKNKKKKNKSRKN